jgi:hypothetical protein
MKSFVWPIWLSRCQRLRPATFSKFAMIDAHSATRCAKIETGAKRARSSLSSPHGTSSLHTRTKHFVAHFPKPFKLAGFAERQPAGTYALDHQEELVVGVEGQSAFRRVGMFMHLPAIVAGRWTLQLVSVEPAEIECAVVVDLEPSPPRSSTHGKKNGA